MPHNKKREFSHVDGSENAKGKKPRSTAEMARGKYIKLLEDDHWKEKMVRTTKNTSHYEYEWARVVTPPQDVDDHSVLHIIQPYTSEELKAIQNTLAGAAPGDQVYNDGGYRLYGPTKTVPVANYQKTFLNVKEFLDEQKFIETIVNKGWLGGGGKKRKRKTRKRKKTRRRNKKKRKSRRKKTRR